MGLADISKEQAKAILDCAPKGATLFSCCNGVISYYRENKKIDVWEASFLKIFSDILIPKVNRLSDLESQMNIDNLATQTTEEKEFLDSIKPVHLRDYQKGARQEVEWKNGETLDFNGEPCVFIGMSDGSAIVRYTKDANTSLAGDIDEIFAIECLSKPESPEEKEKRERLEAAYDLYLLRCHAVNHPITYEFHEFKSEPEAVNGWLAVVDKTNYRKEQ